MERLRYPIGTQSFEIMRTGGYAYADKTCYVYELVSSGARQVFLSRPRRFGKSLLLSTLEAYFEGRKDLFKGLAIETLEDKWESYPVLRFSFGGLETRSASGVIESVHALLERLEQKFEVKINDNISSLGIRFGQLIQNVAEKTGKRVVVLIDEYDKGIVDILDNKERLVENTELFRPFYSQLKDQDDYLRFVFLTGVSRFRNLTLFSSPNQFQDISMNPQYAAICGLTSDELHTIFAEGVADLAKSENIAEEQIWELLKQKYDGYRFTRSENYLYNPFSILNCLGERRLANFWLTSGGTSKVFMDFLENAEFDLYKLEDTWVSEETLGGPYSLKDPIPLLFQTGYLTIGDYDDGLYRLKIPNGEVRTALLDNLAPFYLDTKADTLRKTLNEIKRAVSSGDVGGLMKLFQETLSKIPYQKFKHNEVEHIYHLVIYLICQMAGINARSEVSVAGGDIDMLIETREFVYVFEFKKDQSAKKALQQIETNAYSLP